MCYLAIFALQTAENHMLESVMTQGERDLVAGFRDAEYCDLLVVVQYFLQKECIGRREVPAVLFDSGLRIAHHPLERELAVASRVFGDVGVETRGHHHL